ncbi:MAG: drug:proton antiporter [Chloroflexota bacterium]|nr:MAG: drug:proton antiporter [Chloroflexota bacterium]
MPHGTTVLDAARALGVEIESICSGRLTCGKCQIAPEDGQFAKHAISSSAGHLSPPDDAERAFAAAHGIDLSQRRLSCVARVIGDVLMTVPEESQTRKQVIRKEAGEITVEVLPAVRLYYVEVEPAYLGSPGDWERLQTALAENHHLRGLTIDPAALRRLQKTLRQGSWAVTVTVWQGRDVLRIEPGYVESLYGLAVDVGSTTIAAHLCDLQTGAVLATEAMMNPQVRYGEDLLSRVSYAMTEAQGLQRLNRAVIRALNELAAAAAGTAGIKPNEITDVVLVGNSVMHHLLLGLDPVELGQLPFALATYDPVDIKARELGLKAVHPGAMVHILPCIAGYVGADNVGVLLAEQTHLDDKITLIVDIGTNAEILLGTRDWMLSASSPTGPAFEGAHITHGQRAAAGAIERVRIDPQTGAVRYKVIGDPRWSDELETGETLRPTGICGSGIIEVVAELFMAGLLDKSGRFVPEADRLNPRIRYAGRTAELVLAPADETAGGKEIVVTQADIRAVQLAKGALYAGVRLLLNRRGIERVDRIKLAGAFGSYIDPLHAMIIGLIPDCDLSQVIAIGNAAGDGARIALLNVERRAAARRAARSVEYVETASLAVFQDTFVDALALPHAADVFPHLEHLTAR